MDEVAQPKHISNGQRLIEAKLLLDLATDFRVVGGCGIFAGEDRVDYIARKQIHEHEAHEGHEKEDRDQV